MGRNHYNMPRPPRNRRRYAGQAGWAPPHFVNRDVGGILHQRGQREWDAVANRAIAEIHYQQQHGNLGYIPEPTVRRMGDDIASYKIAKKYQGKARKPMAEVMLESAQELQAEKMAEVHRK